MNSDLGTTSRDFVAFALHCGVLRFGEFILKSRRVSPYFFNAGLFNTGPMFGALCEYYAEVCAGIPDMHDKMLFGPAYKGIPLVAGTAMRLSDNHGIHVPYAFNRKEVKDHGDGGLIVGAEICGRVVILDDVVTAGTSVREAVTIITECGGTPTDLVIALDRQEKGIDSLKSAVQQVEEMFGLSVHAIATLATIIDSLERDTEDALGGRAYLDAIRRYRDQYGV